jgi:hypothetical protein
MGAFIDHPNKKIIRELWCKPIIKHIYDKLGYGLVYLGLPGLEAIDLLTWIEYIKYVVAIDCGHYTTEKYDLFIARQKIKKLNEILNNLDRKGAISGYSLYLGFIEEIVLKGIDKNGEKFTQKNTVNIYNLDFCNSLTVPLKIVDLKGNVTTYYFKNEVIRKLLEFERDLDKPDHDKRFIMFITVHTNFWEDEAEKYFESKNDSMFDSYKEFIRDLSQPERVVRLLRFYFLDILKQHFTVSSFTPLFFPTIIYNGVGENQLMCFTIAGKFIKQASAIAPFYQNIDLLIHQKFIFPDKNKLNFFISSISEKNSIIDPIKPLEESQLFIR